MIQKVQRRFGFKYTVITVRSDNKKGLGAPFLALMNKVGINIKTTPENTDEPKGLQEAAGKAIMAKTRALRQASGLPESIVNELAYTAVHLLNTTPVKSLGWRTPFEVTHSVKPSVAHYNPIGCRAYVYRRDLRQADKTSPRAHISYLLGYDSTNIFRVWVPTYNKVIRTRDVIFN
jgi:hypothetical protein